MMMKEGNKDKGKNIQERFPYVCHGSVPFCSHAPVSRMKTINYKDVDFFNYSGPIRLFTLEPCN